MSASKSTNAMPCPCGESSPYDECCGRFHSRKAWPETAEALMRSRYTAYVQRMIDYLVDTTHPDARTCGLRKNIQDWATTARFEKLEIVSKSMGSAQDKVGKVEFKATWSDGHTTSILHERSRFKRYQGRWHYVDGIVKGSFDDTDSEQGRS